MMNKHLFFLVGMVMMALMLTTPIQAQNSKKSKDCIAYIRKLYNEAKANVKKAPDDKVTMTSRYTNDGKPDITTQDFYYIVEIIEGPDIPYNVLNLICRTLKGDYNSYEEFLFDPKSEELVFYYVNFEQEEGIKCETRYYMGAADDGTGLKISKFTDTRTGKDVTEKYSDYIGMPWDEGFLMRFAKDQQEAFNHFTLRGWD